MSLNLHGIVRTAINFNNADETVLLVRSLGNTNIQGRIVPRTASLKAWGPRCKRWAGKI